MQLKSEILSPKRNEVKWGNGETMSENGRYFHIAIFQIVPLDSLMQRLYWFVLLLGLVMTTNSKEIIEGEDAQGSLAVNESILFELSTIVDWKYLVFTVNVTL